MSRIKKKLDLLKEAQALPSRINNAMQTRIKEVSDELNKRPHTDATRPIGTKLNGRRWAGQSYGWQSEQSYQKLQTDGEFRRGEQTLRRLGNDVSNVAGQAWRDLPKGAREAVKGGAKAVKEVVWDNQPKPVKEAVKGGLRLAGDVNEAVSKHTNISRQITGEILATAATAGASKAIKGSRIASRLAAKADDLTITRQASGRGVPNRIQRQLDANDTLRRQREAGAVGFGNNNNNKIPKGEREPRLPTQPPRYRKVGEITRGGDATIAELNIARRIKENADRLDGVLPGADRPKTAGRQPDLSRRAEVNTDQWNRTRISGNTADVIQRPRRDTAPNTEQLIKDPEIFNRGSTVYNQEMAKAISTSNDNTTFSRIREAVRRNAATSGHGRHTLRNGAQVSPGVRPDSTAKSLRPKADGEGRLIASRSRESIGETTSNHRIKSAVERKRSHSSAAAAQRARSRSDVPYRAGQAPDGGFASDPSGTGMVRFTDEPGIYGRAELNALQRQWNEEWAGLELERDGTGIRDGIVHKMERPNVGVFDTLAPISGDQRPIPELLSKSRIKESREWRRLQDRASRTLRRRLDLLEDPEKFVAELDETERLSRIRSNLQARSVLAGDVRRQGKLQGYLDRGVDLEWDGIEPSSPRWNRSGHGINEFNAARPPKSGHAHTDRNYQMPLTEEGTGRFDGEFEGMLPDKNSKHIYDTARRMFYFDVDNTSFAAHGHEGTRFIPQKIEGTPYYTDPSGFDRPKFNMNPLVEDMPERVTRKIEEVNHEFKRRMGAYREDLRNVLKESGWVFKSPDELDYDASLAKALDNPAYKKKIESITRGQERLERELKEFNDGIAARFEIINAGDPIARTTRAKNPRSTTQNATNIEAAAADPQKRLRADGSLRSKTLPGRDPLTKSQIEDLITIHFGEYSQGKGALIIPKDAKPTAEVGRVLQAYNALSDDKKLLLFEHINELPVSSIDDVKQRIAFVGGYPNNPDSAITWSDRISERSPKYGGAKGNDARRQQNTLDDLVDIPRTPLKGSDLTKKEQELYNNLIRDDLLSDELIPQNNTHLAKGVGRAKFASDMEEAGRIKDRLIGRRGGKGASGRRADKMTYEDGLHFYGDQTRENYDIGRNKSIKDRERTLRYEQEFANRFPEAYVQGRSEYITAFMEQYGLNSEDVRELADKLMRTDNDAGRVSVINQFRKARQRRGVMDTNDRIRRRLNGERNLPGNLTGDTRVRGVRNNGREKPLKDPLRDPKTGLVYRDSLGRVSDTPDPVDRFINEQLNELLARDAANLDPSELRWNYPKKPTADSVAPVQGPRRAVPPTDRADRKPGVYHNRQGEVIERTIGDRSVPIRPLNKAKPERPVKRGGRIRQRVLDRGYSTPVELRKQKRVQQFIDKRRKQRAAKGIGSRYFD